MPTSRSPLEAADTLSSLPSSDDVSPKTSKKRVRNLARHKDNPLQFLQELKGILRVVSSQEKYGIGWNHQDCIILANPKLFHRVLQRKNDSHIDPRQQLTDFDVTMRGLRFQSIPYGRHSQRMYRHKWFRRNSTVQELECIVEKKVDNSSSLADKTVCFSLPPAPELVSLEQASRGSSEERSTPKVTPEKGAKDGSSKTNATISKKDRDAKHLLKDICRGAVQRALAAQRQNKQQPLRKRKDAVEPSKRINISIDTTTNLELLTGHNGVGKKNEACAEAKSQQGSGNTLRGVQRGSSSDDRITSIMKGSRTSQDDKAADSTESSHSSIMFTKELRKESTVSTSTKNSDKNEVAESDKNASTRKKDNGAKAMKETCIDPAILSQEATANSVGESKVSEIYANEMVNFVTEVLTESDSDSNARSADTELDASFLSKEATGSGTDCASSTQSDAIDDGMAAEANPGVIATDMIDFPEDETDANGGTIATTLLSAVGTGASSSRTPKSKTQDSSRVIDNEEDLVRYAAYGDLDSIIKEWKDNNPEALTKSWNGWESRKFSSYIERKPRLWPRTHSEGDTQNVYNKRMVLVLMSGRGKASSVEEMARQKYTPQLRRETARCLVLEKLVKAQVHALDKRVIGDEFASPFYFHRGDMNDLRRMSSSSLLKAEQFDEVVMDYAWWENAYVQDRATLSFFTESLPKLIRSCKPTGSVFLPCTPYLFAQTVLAVLKRNDDHDEDAEDEEVAKRTKSDGMEDATIELLTQELAADRIAFWNATEVIKNNHYLMSKNSAGLTERIGMGDEAEKKLRQVCAFLSNASVKFVLEQYQKLKVDKPLFIQISKIKVGKEASKQGRKRGAEVLERIEQKVSSGSIGSWKRSRETTRSDTTASKRTKFDTQNSVGQRVFIGWDKECFYGTVQGKRNVMGREVYDVVFDQDKTSFSYLASDVEQGIQLYQKQRQATNKNSRILDIEYL